MCTLKVTNVNYNYGRKRALEDVSFEAEDGLTGVLGANGAGKTTLMRLITTLFPIQQGNISLDNLNYDKDTSEIRKKLGYLPQGFSTYNTLTGREFLSIIANLKIDGDKKLINRQIDEIIEKMDMKQFADNKIKSYSGGMKQKLGFAQILLGDPKLIVVDEPTVGLDPEQRNIIRELFPVISQNRIVMATTHIVEDIEYYCDYLLVIKEGRIIYKGTKENFIEKAGRVIWKTEGDAEVYSRIAEKANILSRIQKNDITEIKYVSEEKLTPDSESIEPNLQDAYIASQHISSIFK